MSRVTFRLPCIAFFAAVLPILGASPSLASDWSGCYAGLSAGGAIAEGGATDSPFAEGAFAGSGASWNSAGAPYETIDTDGSGLAGGLAAGCDMEAPMENLSVVFGVAADAALLNLEADGTSDISTETTASFDVDGTATFRARAGIAAGNALFYATGGLAAAHLTLNAQDNTSPGLMDVSESGWQAGWVLGAGLEWQISERWSAQIEYQHMAFDGLTATGAASDPVGAFPRFEGDLDIDIVKLGLMWRL